jgi:hypothetical protein
MSTAEQSIESQPFSPSSSKLSFFTKPDENQREALLSEYLAFLLERNGSLVTDDGFSKRDAWLATSRDWTARHRTPFKSEHFERNYKAFNPSDGLTKAQIALLAFAKVNAGEAYGVEVVSKHRHNESNSLDSADKVERLLSHEEVYHTKILLGAVNQFGLVEPKSAWKPPVPLQVLIHVLAYTPKTAFHPVLLGSEIAGVFTFNWMLNTVREVFRDEPELRDTLEERLIEVLIDEIGHISFNRLMVGQSGLKFAKWIAPQVAANTACPEFKALGWNSSTIAGFESFDIGSLPEEVRSRSFQF